jgi:hypothetical protein
MLFNMKNKNLSGKKSHRAMKGDAEWVKRLYPELFLKGHKSQRKKLKKTIKIEKIRENLYV